MLLWVSDRRQIFNGRAGAPDVWLLEIDNTVTHVFAALP